MDLLPQLKSTISKNQVFSERKYSVFAGVGYEKMAEMLEAHQPRRFEYYPTSYKKFPSFIKSMTIVLPFYPVGTMDRVDVEGKVATANTYAMILSNLPSCGKSSRLMIYDIHALQERFYFHGSVIPSLHSAMPLVLPYLQSHNITAIAFPDDGAAKRFGQFFSSRGYDIIICGKVRDGKKRIVRVQDGDPAGKCVLVVDDLVQTGGTIYEAGKVIKRMGAQEVSAYVTHGVFPGDSWRRFVETDDDFVVPVNPPPASVPSSTPSVTRADEQSVAEAGAESGVTAPQPPSLYRTESPCLASRLFKKFWITNSIPQTAYRIPTDSVFEVIDLLPQIIKDLEFRHHN